MVICSLSCTELESMASRSSVARAEPRIEFCRVMRVMARPTNGIAERVRGGADTSTAGGGEFGLSAIAEAEAEAVALGTPPLVRLSLVEDVRVWRDGGELIPLLPPESGRLLVPELVAAAAEAAEPLAALCCLSDSKNDRPKEVAECGREMPDSAAPAPAPALSLRVTTLGRWCSAKEVSVVLCISEAAGAVADSTCTAPGMRGWAVR